MTADWLGWLRDVIPREPAAMVSVLATEGSAPRGAGTRMLVTAGAQGQALHGTIGGGALEYRAVEQARAVLALRPGTWRVQDYPLGQLLGQCCGGRVRLLIEHVDPAALGWLDEAGAHDDGAILVSMLGADGVVRRIDRDATVTSLSARGERPDVGVTFAERIGQRRRPLYLFGAGHVGQAIARHAAALPLRLAWFDSRPELEGLDGVTIVAEDGIAACVAEAPADAAVLILTHDHALDYRLSHAALARPRIAFTGLIGSATKRARFLSRLAADGIGSEARGRLTCPIGLPGVDGKEPDVIAISVLAQLLQFGSA